MIAQVWTTVIFSLVATKIIIKWVNWWLVTEMIQPAEYFLWDVTYWYMCLFFWNHFQTCGTLHTGICVYFIGIIFRLLEQSVIKMMLLSYESHFFLSRPAWLDFVLNLCQGGYEFFFADYLTKKNCGINISHFNENVWVDQNKGKMVKFDLIENKTHFDNEYWWIRDSLVGWK